MDPLASNYPYFTPYQFAGNKPIMFIDLDGAEFQIPTFEKFKYGKNPVMSVITVVDNVAINLANGGITLVNGGIYTVHRVYTDPTSIPEEIKSDLGAMAVESGKYFNHQYNYVAHTPFRKLLADGVESLKNPETYEGPAELAASLFLTKNLKIPKNSGISNELTERLQNHVSRAVQEVDALGDAAFTNKQLSAIYRNPNLKPMYRGNRIDVRARQYIKDDPILQHLESNYSKGPDFMDPSSKKWWDMTTPTQWQKHLDQYGGDGTLLDTKSK